jgi:AraC-like DNA-binding protein
MTTVSKLAEKIARHAPVDGTFETELPGVSLIRWSAPSAPMPVVYEPTACFVAGGRKHAALGATSYIYDTSQFLLASVDLPVIGTVIEASPEAPYLCLQLDLDVAELAELAFRYPPAGKEPAWSPKGLTLNQITPDLIDAATRLVGLLDTPGDREVIGPLVMREILYRLLMSPSGNVLRHMARSDSRLSQVSRAISWIRANFREPCRIEEAAEIAGMSRSNFHLHFKAITSMSPIEFRTQLRMQEARRLMVGDALDAATAGFNVGYESPSHFSRDYARVFGAPPAAYAQRLRASVARPSVERSLLQ